ncbi:MAG: amidase family protein, partial [Albidovulum sp.]|nr:amidase family protein [Albidovulum sp.]
SVAAGIFPAGLGTDTGGSNRIPAALCGVVGFRPTTGRYDGDGIIPISRTRDTVGPMARSVRDIVLLDSVLSGESDSRPECVDIESIALGIPRKTFFDGLERELEDAIETHLGKLASAGAKLVEIDLEAIWPHNEAFGFPVVFYETARDLPAYLREHAPDVSFESLVAGIGSPDVAGVFAQLLGEEATSEESYRAAIEEHRPAMRRIFSRAFEESGLDAIAFPTTPLTARPVGDDQTVVLNGGEVSTFATYIRNTDLGSNIGAPGISLPCPDVQGMPVGIEFDALPGEDRSLLGLARTIEHAMAQ